MTPDEIVSALEAFPDKFKYTLEEALSLQRQLSCYTSLSSFKAYRDHLAGDRNLFLAVRRLLGRKAPYTTGFRTKLRDGADDYATLTSQFLSLPLSNSNFALWATIMLLEYSSFANAATFAKSRKREEALTADLFGSIRGAAAMISPTLHEIAGRLGQEISLQDLELQIGGRETVTGGDTALFIEWTNLAGEREIIPAILQSKKYLANAFALDHQNGDGQYQFHVLKKRPCQTAYLVFQNNPEKPADALLPPLVKSTSDIPDVKKPTSTPAREKAVTIAAYVMRLLQQTPQKHRHPDPETAIAKVVEGVAVEELANLVVVSSEFDAVQRFQAAWNDKLVADGKMSRPLGLSLGC